MGTPGGVEPVDWNVGDVILDLYEVRELLGQGGMGQVYRVFHRGWNLDLAVKSPRPELVGTPVARDLFITEAQTWVNLDLHPNTVSCYYVRTIAGVPRVFVELVGGGTLLDWIWHGRLYEGHALANILDVAIQFARGLQHAHNQGLLHFDVKPANVMLTADGVAKVTDFGLSQAFAADGRVATDSRFEVITTPEYAAPEALDRQYQLSASTDIWSWAATVTHMFLDVVPSYGPAARVMLDETEPRVPIPEPVLALLRTCFEEDPARRPADLEGPAAVLVAAWEACTGQAYPRRAGAPGSLYADTLNNRGVSLWDLGQTGDARRAFDDSLRAHPGHVGSAYNRGLLLWRGGEQTDLQTVAQLRTLGDGAQVPLLLAHVHQERGDLDAARQAAAEARRRGAASDLADSEGFRPVATLRHEGATQVRISAGGERVLSLGNDLRLWDVSGGRSRVLAPGVTALAATPDFATTVTASQGVLTLWDVALGRPRGVLPTQDGNVQALALSDDGDILISGASDGKVCLWTLSGPKLRVLGAHAGPVVAAALHLPAGLAVTADRETLQLWDVPGRRSLWMQPMAGLTAVALLRESPVVAATTEDGTLWLWALDGSLQQTLPVHADMPLALCPLSGDRLASCGRDGTVRITERRCRRTLELDGGWVFDVHAAPGGRLLAAACHDGTIRVWDVPEHLPLAPAFIVKPRSSEAVQDAAAAAAAAYDEACDAMARQAWDTALHAVRRGRLIPGCERSPRLLALWRHLLSCTGRGGLSSHWVQLQVEQRVAVHGAAVDRQGRLGFTGGDDRLVTVWDLMEGTAIGTLGPEEASIASLACTYNGQGLVVTRTDGVHAMWDLTSGTCLRRSSLLGSQLSLTPDGRYLAVAGPDAVHVLETHEGASLASMRVFARSVWLSGDGYVLASGNRDGLLRIWDVRRGETVLNLHGHTMAVLAIHGTADGGIIVSGGDDQTVQVWDVRRGRCLKVLSGHTRGVTAVQVTADGAFVVSGGKDKQVRIWDVRRGTCLATLRPGNDWVTAVALDGWGDTLLCTTRDGMVMAYHLDWDLMTSPVDVQALEEAVQGFLAWYTSYPEVWSTLQDAGWREPDALQLQAWLSRYGMGGVDGSPEALRLLQGWVPASPVLSPASPPARTATPGARSHPPASPGGDA